MTSSAIASIRYIPLAYDPAHSEESALRLVEALGGRAENSKTTFVQFTDGITNFLLKAETRGTETQPQHEVDHDAILLRAYGPGTDVLIDRECEIHAHTQLAAEGLASPLLARFDNGLLYHFIPGEVCKPEDIRRREVYRLVAAKLGQWHGALSLDNICPSGEQHNLKDVPATPITDKSRPKPNLWTVMESWLAALPQENAKDRDRQTTLRNEFAWLQERLAMTTGLAGRDFVFGHCDLLCGNIIMQKKRSDVCLNGSISSRKGDDPSDVIFIDYEYATATPAAFDIANHFSEWGGQVCDYSVMPTQSERRDFLSYYVDSFFHHSGLVTTEAEREAAIEQLKAQVDLYRGAPGFYWGVWSLIQAKISPIDFDYATYADTRLAEYYAWKATETQGVAIGEQTLRERRWAQV